MPRAARMAQADITRALRAFRRVFPQATPVARILPDGTLEIRTDHPEAKDPEQKPLAPEPEIRM